MAAEQILRVKLKVVQGPEADEEFVIEKDKSLRFGSNASLAEAVFADAEMSLVHFAVTVDALEARIRDLNSRTGTFVNGQRVVQEKLKHGDKVEAGAVVFAVEVETDKKPPHVAVAKILRNDPAPLFALLDSARDPGILPLVADSGQPYQSLFEGPEAPELAQAAPYLVQVDKKSKFLDEALERGWGQSWGMYLSAPMAHGALRSHLRESLMVKNESGEEYYFRFYDPRVLPTYLRTAKPEEARRFFGAIQHIRMEGSGPEVLLEFGCGAEGVTSQEINL
jgi:hypothetical protein